MVDWFGIWANDLSKKCVFCQDKRVNPFDEQNTKNNSYKTTSCRHRVCGNCEDDINGRPVCPLCKSNIGQLKSKDPQFLALEVLNDIKKRVFEVFNLDLDRDFNGNVRDYNDFVEKREEYVSTLLACEQAGGEEKKAMLQRWEKEKQAFVQKHKLQIERNAARMEEHRRTMRKEITAFGEMLKQNKVLMKREKVEEENRRLVELKNRNESRLGTRVSAPSPTAVQKDVVGMRMAVPNIDILAKVRFPPPKRVKHVPPTTVLVNGAKMSAEFTAGGKREADRMKRTEEEMRSGWNLLF